MAFLDNLLNAYRTVMQAGVAVLQRQSINFRTGFVVGDDPINKVTNVDATAAQSQPNFTVVSVNPFNSPFVPAAGTFLLIDPTGGPVIVSPPAMPKGQAFIAKIQDGKTLGGSSVVTLNPISGGQIGQLVPQNGLLGSSIVLGNSSQNGTQLLLTSDGVNIQVG